MNKLPKFVVISNMETYDCSTYGAETIEDAVKFANSFEPPHPIYQLVKTEKIYHLPDGTTYQGTE